MDERAERREEIKLVLEYVKLTLSLGGVVAVIIAVLQWNLANQAAAETIYQRMTTEWKDHLKYFVDKPLLRPYFEERKQLASNDQDAQVVLALADVRLDTADAILSYAALWRPNGEIVGWTNTFTHAFQVSPVLCARFNETQDNYGLIKPIGKAACSR